VSSTPSPDAAAPRRRVVVLAGPSGAGKSRLATRLSARHGWPTVRLDDFYRDGDDPALPMLPIGIPDWDHPDSWHAEAAVTALERLSTAGRVDVPDYDISASRARGCTTLVAEGAQVVLAEGIFAAEIVPHLQERGLLATAYCIRQNRWVTFWRRLVRDLAERRKPPLVLWQRGLRLCRAEPGIVRRHTSLGLVPRTPHEAERELEALLRVPS
jgi:uridine kinase